MHTIGRVNMTSVNPYGVSLGRADNSYNY